MSQTDNTSPTPSPPFDFDYAPGALEVQFLDLAIATADRSDPLVDDALCTVLRILREQHATDAAFVLELIDGRRVQRMLSGAVRGSFHTDRIGDPLDFAMARQAVPHAAPCYIRVPVVLANGRLYGTLYGPCHDLADEARQRDLKRLELTAQLAARLIDARRARPLATGTAAMAEAQAG